MCRLRRPAQVGNAAPAVAALATGTDKEKQVSEQYGGQAGDSASLTDPIYITVGQVGLRGLLSAGTCPSGV